MKKIQIVILLMFLLTGAAVAQKRAGIAWQSDFKQAQALSRETGKPLMLDFTAVWCAPCRAMDERFWTRAEVVETVESFVAVKINYDTERGLAGRFRVRGLPYVAFVDPIGNLIEHRKGFDLTDADRLAQIFDGVPRDFSPLKKAYAAVELKNNDGTALLEIADFYRELGMLLLSNDFYARANRTYVVNKDADRRERIDATIGLNFYAVKDYKQANVLLEQYLKIYPSGKYEESAVAALAAGYAELVQIEEAERHLKSLEAKFPKSKNLATTMAAVENAKRRRSK